MSVSTKELQGALPHTLKETAFHDLGTKTAGKVRDSYSLGDGRRVVVTTDRISAFDMVLGTLPFKGQVLNTLASWWFKETDSIAPNHVLAVPDPNVTVAMECEALPVEFVLRAYLTGVTSTSIWTHYQRGAREFCGHRLPDGMRHNQVLPEPLLTPSTKAAGGAHDISVSREELISSGAVSARDFDEASEMVHALFAHGQRVCEARGLILVDTKYELGRDPQGRLRVIDEIHTPDSSRFWYSESYPDRFAAGEAPESFDKEYVRRWLAAEGYRGDGTPPRLPDEVRVEAARRYIQACDQIRGEAFVPDLRPPHDRILAAMEGAL